MTPKESGNMSDILPDVLPLNPYFREMVWGGRRLNTLFGKDLPADVPIGESFELSAYAGRQSHVCGGPLDGIGLNELVQRYGAELLGAAAVERYGQRMPLLIKLLDARQDLSIQVHPDNAYARARGLQDDGKMEAWLVLHSDGGRVAYGLADGVDEATFSRAVTEGRVEEVIRFFPVQRGDIVFSPPGTVHALCAGVVIYEVQQSSDLTFRIYDYDRPGLDGSPRELHLEQALDVINFSDSLPPPQSWSALPGANENGSVLVDCEHFYTRYVREASSHCAAADSFVALTVVGGQALLRGTRDEWTLTTGTTVLLPAQRSVEIEQIGHEVLEYVVSSVQAN